MKFVLRWKRDASDELADIWVAADSADRREITTAVREIERSLESDPYQHSESRERDRRIIFCAPVALTFRVDSLMQRVEVLRIRRYQ